MAETVAACPPADAAAASAAAHFAAAAAAAALAQQPAQPPVILDGEQYVCPSGSINGIKCCTKCGATKTPQWREGPCGPKTLCNACGVKRTRKLRAEAEGAKRRKLSASPAPPPHKGYGKYARQHYGADAMDSYGSLEPDNEAWGPPSAPGRRPQRRAAEEAAFRTARYARTGEWAEGDAADAALRAATPSSSSGYSLPSSSCPEEVSWPPLADAQLGSGSSDCYAAVNLMTMSAKQRSGSGGVPAPAGGLFSAAPAPAPFVGAGPGSSVGGTSAVASPALSGGTLGCATAVAASRPHSSLDVEQFNHDSMAALAAKYDGTAARHHKVVPVDVADLSACLPPAKVLELVRLNQELEMAVHEAHAANAAVAAVAQVLASKQAAALRSRETASAATKRLRRFMAELDTQFGIQSKLASGKRPPLSPTKPAGLASPSVMPSAAPLYSTPTLPALATQPTAAGPIGPHRTP
ncbi:GATA transcription factor 16 [Chlorella sorokiniana]|uniref:GATA transcription factor 16 n=1 Tax=Chlorella sorokiniana TaxID=3076 RepID=A0A2P6TY37_CHLSO|nr:GATA transcription factor 16 [Chlorella sorokiniana]|eukprot:PRW58971.1 GATA transcription factor 16 [Chlorella sorokiniana]